jgi:ABC-type Fe3+/spermidine/putrescine transport system ATPase subunit
MDEPLGALDKNLRYQMQVEIKEIQHRLGMTVVYVTHDQEEAMNLSDRIAIMNSGRIVQVGPPAEIYERPQDVFIARFLGEANLIEGTIEEVVDDHADFRTMGDLRLSAPVSQRVERGARASLFVRPERVEINQVDAASAATVDSTRNRARGRVSQASYLGNILRYAVDIAPGQSVSVDVQNTSDTRPIAVGENVSLTWRAADSALLLQ